MEVWLGHYPSFLPEYIESAEASALRAVQSFVGISVSEGAAAAVAEQAKRSARYIENLRWPIVVISRETVPAGAFEIDDNSPTGMRIGDIAKYMEYFDGFRGRQKRISSHMLVHAATNLKENVINSLLRDYIIVVRKGFSAFSPPNANVSVSHSSGFLEKYDATKWPSVDASLIGNLDFISDAVDKYVEAMACKDNWKRFFLAFHCIEIATEVLYNFYKQKWLPSLSASDKACYSDVCKFFRKKPSISIKFCACLLLLAPKEFDDYMGRFKRIKDARNCFAHGDFKGEIHLPDDDALTLAANFLGLYVAGNT
ncbi:hypothetical protein [Caenispirillum bisanense]|uniref:hypothetical protein n=1 Tax=Caenispirillum bisanense TaxID=414052 RepID=UPI001143542C|nr:hypothetical protein [Caenispirillum bisanense]